MARRNRKSEAPVNDWHLWYEVSRSVSPLKPATKLPVSPKEPMEAEKPNWQPGKNTVRHPLPSFSPQLDKGPRTEAGRVIEPNLRKKLVRGRIEIDGTIDLHGLKQTQAHAALCRFIAARFAKGDRTILVITGKGLKKTEGNRIEQRGVLRIMLPIWLSEPALAPMIAGFEQASRLHGGEGAYYVRLKRSG